MSDVTLQPLSRGLAAACAVVGIVVPILTLVAIFTGRSEWFSGGTGSGAEIAALVVSLVPLLLFLWTLDRMRRLFESYAVGAILTARAAEQIVDIGKGFFALALAPLVVKPVVSVLNSLGNAPGERELVISLHSDTLFFALVSGLLIVIGWAMRQAAEIAEDNRAIV